MDPPRVQNSGAASAVLEILLQKARVPLEKVPQARRAFAVIVDWSCSREIEQCMSKRDSIGEQGLSGYAFRGEIEYGYTPMRCI